MKTSDNGIKKIKNEEGFRNKAYKCSAGVPTIGYGHTKGVKMGDTISDKKAEEYLREDLRICENEVNKINKEKGYNLNQNQFDSLVSFTYNCGVNNLRTLTRYRTKSEIPEGMKLYNKAGGRVIQGLINRRSRESELFQEPISNNNKYSNIFNDNLMSPVIINKKFNFEDNSFSYNNRNESNFNRWNSIDKNEKFNFDNHSFSYSNRNDSNFNIYPSIDRKGIRINFNFSCLIF